MFPGDSKGVGGLERNTTIKLIHLFNRNIFDLISAIKHREIHHFRFGRIQRVPAIITG